MKKPDIYIYDEFSPQDIAMMQALYSRSPKSVVEHVDKVKKSGSGKFMQQFYVGYGHASIADCGSTTIFIENISVLADKAIQDWPLYSGQETSTRYVDMSKQDIIDPLSTADSKAILNDWMSFYLNSFSELESYLISKFPIKPDEDEAVYQKAIKARAFDILRGFLPAGIATQLSWHTNLRQAWDKLALLRRHPLEEVRETANSILTQLQNKYPESFCFIETKEQEQYRSILGREFTYYSPNRENKCFNFFSNIKVEELEKYKKILNLRPPKTALPYFIQELGNVTFEFVLDYGCFRDLQRHRNGVCRMPLLTTKIGFSQWYLNQLPTNLRAKAEDLIARQIKKIGNLNSTEEVKQYYIAMGFNVDCKVTYGLMAAAYVAELRSNKTVHPALRSVAKEMHMALKSKFPSLKLFTDLEKDEWDVRRGLDDIITVGEKCEK